MKMNNKTIITEKELLEKECDKILVFKTNWWLTKKEEIMEKSFIRHNFLKTSEDE